MEFITLKDEYKKKCGEIFADDDNIFSFICTFCETLFLDIEKFIEHVKIHHIKSCKIENPLEPNDEDSDEREIIKIELKEDYIENDSNDIMSTDYLEDIKDVLNQPSTKNTNTENQRKLEINLQDSSVFNETQQSTKKKRIRNYLKKLVCDLCKNSFATQKSLEWHKKYDHLPTNPFVALSNSINQPDALNDNDSENENEKKCDERNTAIFGEYDDPLKCRYCDRRLKSRKERAEHECLHTGEKPYACEICGKRFRMEKLCNRHIAIHKDERPHKCDICDASFKDRTNLIVHIRRHNNDKRFKCNYCDKLFLQQTQRKQHERVHTGERPYQCNQCGKCFQTSSKLGIHVRRHIGFKPYKCNDCDRAFCTRQQLNEHVVKHTGERPYACEVCNATFPRKETLRSHRKIHLDSPSYICKICGKGFKQHPGLYIHMKSHGEIIMKK